MLVAAAPHLAVAVPDPAPSPGAALARLLEDAPPLETNRSTPEGQWYRYDLVAHWPVIVDGNGRGRFVPDYPLWSDTVIPTSRDGIVATHGGTDTSRATSVDDGFQLGGDPAKATVLPSDDDSTEVVVSHFGGMPWTNDQEYWFYAEWSLAFVQCNWCVGLWGGNGLLRGENTSKGSCFDTNDKRNHWDGKVNPSNDGIFFRGPGDSSQVIDAVRLIVYGAGLRAADTTAIELFPPVHDEPRLEVPRMTFALHVFGRDSVQYWANGQTGTVSTAGLSSTEILQWRFCCQDAAAPFGTQAGFWSAWAATRPRLP